MPNPNRSVIKAEHVLIIREALTVIAISLILGFKIQDIPHIILLFGMGCVIGAISTVVQL